MKSILLKIFSSLLFIAGITICQHAAGQTVTFDQEITNLNTGTLTGYTNNLAVYGFKITVTGATESIGTVNIKDGIANAEQNIFTNGRLYSTPTQGYNAANPGTVVGTVTFGSSLITISGMNENFAVGETRYYYLVVDCIATTATQFQPFIGYAQSPTGIISTGGTAYNNNNNGYENYYMIAAGTPPPMTLSNLTGGLTSNTTTLVPGQSGVVVFGFSVTTTANFVINQFNINSTSSALSSYIASAVLYRTTGSTYSATGAVAVGTATIGTSKINVASASETINSATKYYFLVVTLKSSFPTGDDIQFNFTSGQSPAAVIRTTGSPTPANTFNVLGSSYNYNSSLVTVTSQQASVSSGTITPNQTGIILFGFGVTSTKAVTFSQININSNNANISGYFGNAKLYYCATSTYSVGSRVLAGNVAFSGYYATATLTAQNSFTAGQTRYYFLVADDIGGATSTTVAFSFVNGQSADALVQSVPVTSGYNTFAITGNTFTVPAPTIFVTGANSTSTNGITSGTLVFGQSDIVLFGFAVQGFGASQTFSNINIKTSGSEQNYFSNGRLYRSTTAVFPGGTPLYSGSAVTIGGAGYIQCTVNETIPAGSTYYYWFVADYTVNTGPPNSAYTFSFSSSQPTSFMAFVSNPYSTAYNTYNVTGNAFNIATTEDWTGAVSNSFTDAGNFKLLDNSPGSIPTASTIIRIGGVAYTNLPAITANTTIGGLTFGSLGTPTVNVTSGTLTLNTALNTLTGSTGKINGAGTIKLAAASISNIGDGSTLNVSGGLTLNNTGTVTMSSTSTLNVTGNSTITNTGTFTLQSDADGSATVGPVTGSLTGNYNVERYLTGNSSGSRGWRLLSSPVSVSSSSLLTPNLTYVHAKAYTTGSTGTSGGFDATGNPTFYFYRENIAPNTTSFISGNFRGVNKINNTTASTFSFDGGDVNASLPAGNGYLFFFRGDKATTNNPTLTTTIAKPTTITALGYLNQGSITVKPWFTGASTLSYTSATSPTVRGFNLVGNPYASSIDWDLVTKTNITNTIWVYNPVLKVYATYVAGTNGVGTNFNGASGTADIIPSGQGFFVKANSTAAALTFTESNKVNTQVSSSNLLLAAAPTTTATIEYLRIQIYQDSLNNEDALVFFNKDASSNFVQDEDAEYFKGESTVNISTQSADNVALAVNQLPHASARQVIPLNVNISADGQYQLNLKEIKNVPQVYDIYLVDYYKKDSLNIRNNNSYLFNATVADPNSFGSGRFSLVIKPNQVNAYHLVEFTALKVLNTVQLSWKTQNESSTTMFVVERSTDGGATFNAINTSTSAGVGSYSYTDPSPNLSGENLYRLKQQDITGLVTSSNIVLVSYLTTSGISNGLIKIYPNPTSSIINLTIPLSNGTVMYDIVITGIAGRIVKTISTSQTNWQGDVSALLPGTYFIEVINKTDKKLIGKGKFIKL